MVWYGMVRYSTVQYGMVRYGTVWYGMPNSINMIMCVSECENVRSEKRKMILTRRSGEVGGFRLTVRQTCKYKKTFVTEYLVDRSSQYFKT